MGSLVIGDLHLGNYYSDILKFLQLLDRARNYSYRINEIILLGDVVDGIDKYQSQSYKHYPETLSLQRNYTRWLIELLHNEFSNAEIVLTLGNHEKDFRGIILDEEAIQTSYTFLKIREKYVDTNRFLYIHQLNARMAAIAGWSTLSISLALAEISSIENTIKERLAGIVTAHVHRGLSYIVCGGYHLIIMTSFLKDHRTTAKEAMFNPAIIIVERWGDKVSIDIFSDSFNDNKLISKFNDILSAIIRSEYRKITSIDKTLKLLDLI